MRRQGDAGWSLGIGGAVGWIAVFFLMQVPTAVWMLYAPADISLEAYNWVNALLQALTMALLLWLIHWRYPAWRPGWRVDMGSIGMALGGAVVCYIGGGLLLSEVLTRFFSGSLEAYNETMGDLMFHPVTAFLTICVIAPIAEELLMRGFVLEGMKRRYGVWPAILLSTLLFAAMHMNLAQGVGVLVVSLALALLYVQTGSVAACILMHAFYNLCGFLSLLWLG